MCSANQKELIEVVKYFRDQFDGLWQKHVRFVSDTGTTLLVAGLKIVGSHETLRRRS
jgi:hypothetical protein